MPIPSLSLPSPRQVARFARRFVLGLRRADCLMVAAALTYTTLLALVPLLTITVLVFRNFPAFEEIGLALRDFLSANLLPEAAAKLVTFYTREFVVNAARLSVIGTLMLIVTALLLLATIESAFDRIWHLRRPRPIAARLVTYWFVLTAGPLLFGSGVYLTTRLARESLRMAGLGALATPLVSFVLIWAFLWALYQLVPRHPVRSRHAGTAAFLATLAFLLVQRGFTAFISRFATYDLVYGAFAAIPIFLVWIYVLWAVILAGAVFGATLARLPDQSSGKGSTSY